MIFRASNQSFSSALLRRHTEFFEELDLIRPPSRFWGDGTTPELVTLSQDANRVELLSTPAQLLSSPSKTDNWMRTSRRALARLHAWFLITEDRQRRLDRQAVVALAHQASLVRHCLDEANLARVLIADEVGLGKTVEAGLIVKALLAKRPGLRVLYLAPARLVKNVHSEFERLGLRFRLWTSDKERNASLDDDRIIASIHRASHEAHFSKFVASKLPWDVVIVDECHHLSDWAEGGGSPVRKYRLVEELVEKLGPSGRLILLSGTPHQGHPHRFENLLKFLVRPGESSSAVAGRVIYRTKEDVRDWEGRPLFPGRQVNSPIAVDLTASHRKWLEDIHSFFEPERGDASSRAAGWRAGLALQWATSSVQAGLGFLVRQGLRARLKLDWPGIRPAIESLRPYRQGAPDEPADSVFERLLKEIDHQAVFEDFEDMEEIQEARWQLDPKELSELLRTGVDLLRTVGDLKWKTLREKVLDVVGNDKVVLFAQPIETVTALASFLEGSYGQRPAVIVGAQSDAERQAEILRFRNDPNLRFLVSSRAGGEGINLQIARRLVHVDVPWNPMEMEQRVGRVHRFGSRQTIIVDTLVVSGSRETDAYRIAYEKLVDIAASLVPQEKFQSLFARVMALVPPEELQAVMGEAPLAPLSPENCDRLAGLVTEGFNQWRTFDKNYAAQQRAIRGLDPGAATWEDIVEFLELQNDAKRVPGFATMRFRTEGGQVEEEREDATVITLAGTLLALGETDGMPVTAPDGRTASAAGLNTSAVAAALREAAVTVEAIGAAALGWTKESRAAAGDLNLPATCGVLGFGLQTVGSEAGQFVERGESMLLYLLEPGQEPRQVEGARVRQLVRALQLATIRREPRQDDSNLVQSLLKGEEAIWGQLRRPAPPSEPTQRVLVAVVPLFAAIVS